MNTENIVLVVLIDFVDNRMIMYDYFSWRFKQCPNDPSMFIT